MEVLGIVAVIAIALFFDYTNGFHDAANAIATSISTRALTPRVALVLAAVMNFLGAFLGTKVAATVFSVIEEPQGEHALVVVFAALAGAITWNLITWRLGLPSSSSHALIGGLVGAGLAGGETVDWNAVVDKVVYPMLLSPVVGFVLAALLMLIILWTFRNRRPGPTNRGFRMLQTLSASAMALGHGLQDAQKTMGVIVLALVIGGYQEGFAIPWWVVVLSASAISLGTWSGGWRIMRTLGRRIIEIDPARGFAAETVAASVLFTTAYVYAAPISTTQAITGSIMGAGVSKGRRAVRWGVAGNILTAWVLTLPMSALMAAACYEVVHAIIEH